MTPCIGRLEDSLEWFLEATGRPELAPGVSLPDRVADCCRRGLLAEETGAALVMLWSLLERFGTSIPAADLERLYLALPEQFRVSSYVCMDGGMAVLSDLPREAGVIQGVLEAHLLNRLGQIGRRPYSASQAP